jgi:uncharacterized linocin/CFP29 family protein
MDDRNAQVGWTEAQWNRVREEVLRAWQRVRVAGSFLPVYGPLPPSTQVVPSEVFKSDGTGMIDDQATAVLLEISLPVKLTRQQVGEEELTSALLQFRRRATQVGQLEDWYIFNGQYPRGGPQPGDQAVKSFTASLKTEIQREANAAASPYRPTASYVDPKGWPFLKGVEEPIVGVAPLRQKQGLLRRHPGALGLIEGAVDVEDPGTGDATLDLAPRNASRLNNKGLMDVIVTAITTLEQRGYVAPHVCVFGRGPFRAAHEPIGTTTAFPRDRLEPLIGREILHASAIDVRPEQAPVPDEQAQSAATRLTRWEKDWQNRGLLLSLAGDPIDLAIAAEATPEFRHLDGEGRYVFSVFERFTLRIKDRKAIVALAFED